MTADRPGRSLSRRTLLRSAVGSAAFGLTTGCLEDAGPDDSASDVPDATGSRPSPDVDTEDRPTATDGQSGTTNSMTFFVEVPANAPVGDHLFVWTNDQRPHAMDRTGDRTFTVELNPETIGLDADVDPLRYRYDRMGRGFYTAEYIEPDTEDHFWRALGRSVPFEPGAIQRDVVNRWRWWPPDGTPIRRTSPLEAPQRFAPRVDDLPFHSGQVIEDLYEDSFRPFFDSTATHLADVGYSTVVVAPPWQWLRDDPPTVGNGLALGVTDDPNYPDDETLREHIQAFKRAGLSVLLGPQICCTGIDTRNRSVDWWETYYDEVERFLIHHADIAEATGVVGLFYGAHQPPTDGPVDAEWLDARWRRTIREVRKHYGGEFGQVVWKFIGPDDEPGLIPPPDFFTWGDALDFIYFINDAAISVADNPSEEALVAGAGAVLDPTKELYDRYGTPTIVRTLYFGVRHSWKGATFYDIGSVPPLVASETAVESAGYQLSKRDHSRALNAYFAAVGERPWVTGLVQFGYTHWEYPLAADLSIRGEPAEDLWRRWNRHLASTP